jgi:hypothetical protein
MISNADSLTSRVLFNRLRLLSLARSQHPYHEMGQQHATARNPVKLASSFEADELTLH